MLILRARGVYDLTINDMQHGFSQSQTEFLLGLPSNEAVQNHAAIKIRIAPSAASNTTFDKNNLPTKEELADAGRNETSVG